MENISLKNITLEYLNNTVFNNLSFDVIKNNNTSIIGTGGVGKTSLAKILNGTLPYNGEIKINGNKIDKFNTSMLKKYIAVVLNERLYSNNILIDELFDSLEVLNLSIEEEKERIKKIVSYFHLDSLLEKKISSFSMQDRYFIKVICKLILFTDYIVLDDIFINMDKKDVKKVVLFCKKENITIINFTSDIEYVLDSDYLIVLYDGGIAMEGKTLECLKEEKVIRRLGFNLPFMVDLSIQLGYYGLIDNIITDERKMIKTLWK